MNRPKWIDPFSSEGMRIATAKVLSGVNYRLFFEDVTRSRLILEYGKLAEIARKYPQDNEQWRASIRKELSDLKTNENLKQWLIGLTRKTAINLGIKSDHYPEVFDKIIQDIQDYSELPVRETALMLWCGAATLTTRGSQKSKIGKRLERCLVRAILGLCGLKEIKNGGGAGNFRIGVAADEEVTREIDAEIRTPRSWIRMEVGLIGKGNPEVIGDKIDRLGTENRNSVVLFDFLSAKSSMWKNAEDKRVKLIQLRNNNSTEEMRLYLDNLKVPVSSEPLLLEKIEDHVMDLSLEIFNPDQ